MTGPVVGSEKHYAFIAGGRRIQSVIVDVGMFEGMRVVRINRMEIQMAVPGVSLGEMMVQHRP